jgi:serine/threonine protein kinase
MAGLIGKTIGNYEIVERLGRGAMAVVYKAYQKPLQRYVAIKILHPEVSNDETFLARFRLEARSVAGLRHPNIVQVHDFGTEAGLSYLVMEYVEGPSLKQRIKELRDGSEYMPRAEMFHVVQGVAGALDHAHEQGIIHRDVKPGNIVLTAEKGGDAILTDFGLTRILGMSSMTSSGILGTPEYLSPEQGDGGTIDARSDLYSLGIVVYEMLTSRTPFEGDAPLNMILKHVRGELPSPRTFNPDLTVEVEEVVMKALAHAPDTRYQRAGDMVAALTQAISSQPPGPSKAPSHLPAPVPHQPTPPAPRQPYRRGHIQLIDRDELRRAVSTPPDLETEPVASQASAGPASGLHLLVVYGPRQDQSIPLTGRITLGRAPSNTLPLEDARISRQHASIEISGDQVRLTDLNSTNGTFVNQQLVSTTYLREGDYVQMGGVTLLVQRRRA